MHMHPFEKFTDGDNEYVSKNTSSIQFKNIEKKYCTKICFILKMCIMCNFLVRTKLIY